MKKVICFILLLTTLGSLVAQGRHVIISDTIDPISSCKKVVKIQEVQIKGRLKNANIVAGSIGLEINTKELKLLPGLVGETDPLKALQYLGGVSQASEANSGLYVRGGNNDQNLILLNGMPIQNPTHILGMFSVFNPDLINQIRFIKSGIPAEYGNRLSSVVDISTQNSIPDKINIDGSIGFISSRISIQVPISNKLMIYGSYRGSYIGTTVFPLLAIAGIDKNLTQNQYEYWDANSGFVYQFGKRTRFSGHFYTGKDIIRINQTKQNYDFDNNSTNWGNLASCIQYNQLLSENWSMNHQVSYSGFNIRSDLNWMNSTNKLQSSIRNISYKADFFHSTRNHTNKFGLEILNNRTFPNFLKTDSLIPTEIGNKSNNYNGFELSCYLRDEWNIGNWQLNYGVRTNLFVHLGDYTDYSENGNKVYAANKTVKTYKALEPRFYTRYIINNSTSIKMSINRTNQYLNQVPVLSIGIPADIQIPASLHVKPQASWHFSSGYFKNFNNDNWETSCEVYYKTLENQLELNSGIAQSFSNNLLDQSLFSGKGWTYGTEMVIRKNGDRLSGWISYNLAWSYRQFDQINNGEPYLSQNDRRHDLSLATIYKLSKKWSLSTLFVYATGNRLDLPVSWFIIDDKIIWEYNKYNSFEMPAYHRLDISANYKLKHKHGINSELNFSVYNLYNRANPFQVFYSSIPVGQKFNFVIKMSYLLPFIPSISWTFHI
jgi:hypothetical protein